MVLASASRAEGQAGDWKGALDFAERGLRTRSTSINTVTAYVSALAHSSRCDDARKVLEKLRERHKRDPPQAIAEEGTEVDSVCGSR